MGFNDAKKKVLDALKNGTYQHAARAQIDGKNLLETGDVSSEFVIKLVTKCNGNNCTISTHHQISSVEVYVLKKDGWYVKFYFIDPDTFFISVHQ